MLSKVSLPSRTWVDQDRLLYSANWLLGTSDGRSWVETTPRRYTAGRLVLPSMSAGPMMNHQELALQIGQRACKSRRSVNGGKGRQWLSSIGNAVWKLSGLRPFGEHLGRWRTSEDCFCIGICTIYIECLFKVSTSLLKKFTLNGFGPSSSSPGLDD